VQPGLTFTFSPAEGYRGLIKDRPTIVILTSGSDFVTGMNQGRVDMATPYLRDILRFVGVHSVRFVAIGPTSAAATRSRPRAAAERQLIELAAAF
jgi:FMN-dependent NADH-azoreductase